MPTRKPVLAAVAAIILGLSAAVAADGPDLGRVVTAQEIAAWSLSVGPDGVGLPAGSGTPKQGEAVYTAKCVACHGEKGAGRPNDALVGGIGSLPGDQPPRLPLGRNPGTPKQEYVPPPREARRLPSRDESMKNKA